MYQLFLGLSLLCLLAVSGAAPGPRRYPGQRLPMAAFLREKHAVRDFTNALADSHNCKDERPDCDWIVENTGGGEKLENYCNTWKHTKAIQECRKTCNFCGKAPSPVGCEDERPDCKRIEKITGGGEALTKYCNTHKDHPGVRLCKKTCGFCSKPPAPPSKKPQTAKPENKRTTEKPSTTPKPSQLSGKTPSGFQKACLEAHNDFRYFHGVPALKWSAELSRDAQVWANHLAASKKFEHDPTARGKDQGENLYYVRPANRLCDHGEQRAECLSCGEIVQVWYNEEADYDYNTGKAKTPFAVITHFTQLVWRASRELGMATAVDTDNRLVAVARYSPVGNWGGEFKENVPPPENFP